jgi:hypothetical protein
MILRDWKIIIKEFREKDYGNRGGGDSLEKERVGHFIFSLPSGRRSVTVTVKGE